MNYVVVHANYPKAHLCSVHMESYPEIGVKSGLVSYFIKEFSDPHGLRNAWNYIHDNGWDSEWCSCI